MLTKYVLVGWLFLALAGLVVAPAPVVAQAACHGTISAGISGGTVHFINNTPQAQPVGAAVYQAFDASIDTQALFDSQTGVVPACGTLDLTVSLPVCMYQLDAFLGPVLPDLKTHRYGSRLLNAITTTGPYCTANSSTLSIPAGLPRTGYGPTAAATGVVWPFAALTLAMCALLGVARLVRPKRVSKPVAVPPENP